MVDVPEDTILSNAKLANMKYNACLCSTYVQKIMLLYCFDIKSHRERLPRDYT